MIRVPISTLRIWGVAVLTAAGLGAGQAHAQFMGSNSADFNAGWGRISGQENRAVDISTRDVNGNRVIIDGLIQVGEDQSTFARASGAAEAFAGVGAVGGGATAIGNNLTVITQGSNNTVIVNSTQTNHGAVSATTQLNGGVSGE
jgi:holdfast attachment protein HfaA